MRYDVAIIGAGVVGAMAARELSRYDLKVCLWDAQIGEVRKKIHNIRQEVITSENIYRILLAFDELYGCMTELEKRELMRAMLEKLRFTEKNAKMAAGCAA